MSREFYRRDYERQRSSRRDDEGEERPERTRGTSRPRSDSRPRSYSRPDVSRRTTAEWHTFPSRKSSLQSEPSSDPRLRNNTTDGPTEAIQTLAKATGSSNETIHGSTLRTPSATLKPAPAARSPPYFDGPGDIIDKAHALNGIPAPSNIASTASESAVSPVGSIASLLVTFSKEAYSAAYAQQREDGAKKRLADAEKIDQQNRRITNGWTALVEQGEENIKTAVKLLDDATTRRQETEQKMLAAAIVTAARIFSFAKADNVLQSDQINREQEAERISRLEATLSTVSQELAEAKKELQQIKAGTQITSKKVEALTDSQKRDMKGVHSEVADIRLRNNDLKSDIGNVRSDGKKLLQDLQTLQATVGELPSKLSNTVQRPDFIGLSATVESMSKQQASSASLDEARQSHQKLLESDLTILKKDIKHFQDNIKEILADRNAVEKYITERFRSLDNLVAAKLTPEQNPTPAPAVDASLRKDYHWLKDEFQKTQEELTKMRPELRTATDGSKANMHSIRALTQRYNNLTSEDMVHSMLRQLERLYPHASQQQASFDAIRKELRSLSENVNSAFAKVKQDIDRVHRDAKTKNTECHALWKSVLDNNASQRDALKTDIGRKLKTLEDAHAAQLAGLQARMDRSASGVVDDDGGSGELDSSDDGASRMAAMRHSFANGNGVDSGKKRKRDIQQDSLDVLFADTREGSAPLRAKGVRKE